MYFIANLAHFSNFEASLKVRWGTIALDDFHADFATISSLELL